MIIPESMYIFKIIRINYVFTSSISHLKNLMLELSLAVGIIWKIFKTSYQASATL